MRRALLLLSMMVAASCASAPPAPAPKYPEIDQSWYAPFAEGGTASVSGQAFLRTRGGDVKVAAGSPVTLDPATPYSAVWWNNYGKLWLYRAMVPPSPIFRQARQETLGDAEGRFTFRNLAPGTYYVRSQVTWEVPTRYSSSLQGGVVSAEVAVAEGEAKNVVLTWQ